MNLIQSKISKILSYFSFLDDGVPGEDYYVLVDDIQMAHVRYRNALIKSAGKCLKCLDASGLRWDLIIESWERFHVEVSEAGATFRKSSNPALLEDVKKLTDVINQIVSHFRDTLLAEWKAEQVEANQIVSRRDTLLDFKDEWGESIIQANKEYIETVKAKSNTNKTESVK